MRVRIHSLLAQALILGAVVSLVAGPAALTAMYYHRQVSDLQRVAAESQEEARVAQGLCDETFRHLKAAQKRAIDASASLTAIERDSEELARDLAAERAAHAEHHHKVPAATPATYRGDVPAAIRRVCASKGLSAAETTSMLWLARHESGMRPKARNGSSKGLFQLQVSYSGWADPEWNTAAAIRYVHKRYGSASAAVSAWKERASYAGGDWHGGWY
jgi:hypothetical protein